MSDAACVLCGATGEVQNTPLGTACCLRCFRASHEGSVVDAYGLMLKAAALEERVARLEGSGSAPRYICNGCGSVHATSPRAPHCRVCVKPDKPTPPPERTCVTCARLELGASSDGEVVLLRCHEHVWLGSEQAEGAGQLRSVVERAATCSAYERAGEGE